MVSVIASNFGGLHEFSPKQKIIGPLNCVGVVNLYNCKMLQFAS
jgi:hypothetical protein